MPPPPILKPGDRVADYTVESVLGLGGNCEVWVARRDDDAPVALKVLRSRRVESEPYARFRQEVAFHHKLRDDPGVLPILASDVPDQLARGQRAWLSMPIATPVRDALSGAVLERTVEAIANYAETLARLHAEHAVAHRDIKPGNLMYHGDRWLLADFGLVHLPDGAQLTATSHQVGPLHFLAPEVLASTAQDYAPADVWSLAKTLWVLACDQRWPPPGPHRQDEPATRLDAYVQHPRDADLDRVLAAATTFDPRARVSMAAFAEELRSWLAVPPPPPDRLDLSEQGARLRQLLGRESSTRDTVERQKERTYDARDELARLLEPLWAELTRAWPDVAIEEPDTYTANVLGSINAAGTPEIHLQDAAATKIVAGPDFNPFVFRVGRLVELLEPSTLRIAAMFDVGWEETTGNEFEQVFDQSVPLGSLQASTAIVEAADALSKATPAWLDRFIARLPGAT